MTTSEDAAAVVGIGQKINETVNEQMTALFNRGVEGIAAVEQSYIRRMDTLKYTAHVNQQTGSDEADGSLDTPLKSIQTALNNTPRGGYCVVVLQTDYHIASDLRVDQKRLLIKSNTTVKHKITYERFKLDYNGSQYTAGNGFLCVGGATVVFFGITIEIPASEGVFGTYIKNQQGCLFKQGISQEAEQYNVMFIGCEFVIPTHPYSQIFSNTFTALSLTIFSCTFTDQPVNGHLLWGVTNTAGTDPATVPIILTNLSVI